MVVADNPDLYDFLIVLIRNQLLYLAVNNETA